MLIGDALKERPRPRESYVISGKFGVMRDPKGNFTGYDSRPAAIKNFLGYTLQRLRLDYIDIYRPARLDPHVPIEDTIGALSDLVKQGYIRYIGLSEVGPDTLRRAAKVHPISDLQIEYALTTRGIEDRILPTCRELGIGITAYGVLSRGLLSGKWNPANVAPGDWRSFSPRFQKANLETNLGVVEKLKDFAAGRDLNLVQVALAWVLSRGDDILPIVGSRKRDQLKEVLSALGAVLTPADLADLETICPADAIKGARYPLPQMAHLDSEKK
jgi:pyridoxine 4-dehydrogenase